MRVEKARASDGRIALTGTSPYQKQAEREARKRKTARAVGAFFSDEADIAAACGFWHMSKFAADYRRNFGELPSATLRRAAA